MADLDVAQYIASHDEKWQEAFLSLYETVKAHIPKGFSETMQYGMPSFVVPLDIYPAGYLRDNITPLPFISLAIQKRHIAFYHMGIYTDKDLLEWFEEAYPDHIKTKLNMGKSCIRFTNPKTMPFELIAELVSKVSVEEWIEQYENSGRK
ncbi:protein of unknown function (DU1801) [Halolactibacillus halophilus]|uniref:YdhG-like domain-containing protein n=1 Tax=Halolactibacillus halophilus TaxID=306540 RepID=A0A1I5N499_9BACI|nr:DUF1801 domain-containing protein [Halolactibacillus halophilus]GEM01061.1 hypothetical protein HHA03_05930 [Halolactibacillus halophilus]SFP16442.1 protein of unknown function (DU1801) [Halolactibacillus halophilus]